MSGHNKWSKIKHKKAATDAAKSKVFGKLARMIASESRRVGGDVNSPSLRMLTEKARSENMPKDNIERAIAKGKSAEGATLDSIMYETYGPGGAAIIIDVLTDNRNRTAAEIKHLLSKIGFELAAPGSAIWAFEKTSDGYAPQTTVTLSDEDGGRLGDILEALEDHDDVQAVYTNAV
jgi:YebC/PmpR family DNA-binding regulatory protein